jgi:RNA polymerase sporulation-specific sigma factor
MMEYNDYELVAMAQEHNEDATNMLYKKYKPLIIRKSREVYKFLENKGVDINDVIQEAMIGFDEAIRDFNQDDNTLFYTFACICLDRQLRNVKLKFSRNKHRILNEAISFEDVGEEVNILDFVYDDNDNPENEILSEESNREFKKSISSILTEAELEVFNLRIKGYSNKEIAGILNKDVKSVDNTVQRIKLKIKRIKD